MREEEDADDVTKIATRLATLDLVVDDLECLINSRLYGPPEPDRVADTSMDDDFDRKLDRLIKRFLHKYRDRDDALECVVAGLNEKTKRLEKKLPDEKYDVV
jgi:hypothetical protein